MVCRPTAISHHQNMKFIKYKDTRIACEKIEWAPRRHERVRLHKKPLQNMFETKRKSYYYYYYFAYITHMIGNTKHHVPNKTEHEHWGEKKSVLNINFMIKWNMHSSELNLLSHCDDADVDDEDDDSRKSSATTLLRLWHEDVVASCHCILYLCRRALFSFYSFIYLFYVWVLDG